MNVKLTTKYLSGKKGGKKGQFMAKNLYLGVFGVAEHEYDDH